MCFLDYGIITLLYQDSIGGLEIRGPSGSWIDATPIPGAVLINAGDMLEIFTNGKIPAAMHRVVIPELEIKRKTSRQSIVFFVNADDDTPIAPLPNFEHCGLRKQYHPVSALDYVHGRSAVNFT